MCCSVLRVLSELFNLYKTLYVRYDKLFPAPVPLVGQLLPRLRQEPFFTGRAARLDKISSQLLELCDGIAPTVGAPPVSTLYRLPQSRRVFFFGGCVLTGILGICGLLLLPHPTYADYVSHHRHLAHVLPLWRLCLMLNLLCWSCGICTAVFEYKNINFVFLLNVPPRSNLNSVFWFTVASGQV